MLSIYLNLSILRLNSTEKHSLVPIKTITDENLIGLKDPKPTSFQGEKLIELIEISLYYCEMMQFIKEI